MSALDSAVMDEQQLLKLKSDVKALYRDVRARLGDGTWNGHGHAVKVYRTRDTGLLAIFCDDAGVWYFRAGGDLTAARVDDWGRFQYGTVGMDGRIAWAPNHSQN